MSHSVDVGFYGTSASTVKDAELHSNAGATPINADQPTEAAKVNTFGTLLLNDRQSFTAHAT